MFSIFATRMKTLHIFNPEHDIALAANLKNFTAPHAGRQLRSDMGYLPALWAHEDDAILVGDKEYASRAFNQVNSRCHLHLTAPQWVGFSTFIPLASTSSLEWTTWLARPVHPAFPLTAMSALTWV